MLLRKLATPPHSTPHPHASIPCLVASSAASKGVFCINSGPSHGHGQSQTSNGPCCMLLTHQEQLRAQPAGSSRVLSVCTRGDSSALLWHARPLGWAAWVTTQVSSVTRKGHRQAGHWVTTVLSLATVLQHMLVQPSIPKAKQQVLDSTTPCTGVQGVPGQAAGTAQQPTHGWIPHHHNKPQVCHVTVLYHHTACVTAHWRRVGHSQSRSSHHGCVTGDCSVTVWDTAELTKQTPRLQDSQLPVGNPSSWNIGVYPKRCGPRPSPPS
jgi:hypothetical protein